MSGAGSPDFFYRESQRLRYVARSAFKLLQMQEKYKLIKPGSSVLDLGCAPGAWLQVACQSLGPLKNGGAVVGIDIKKVKVPPTHCDARVKTFSADVMNLPKEKIRALSPENKGFSVILSDMCPSVSGITTRDAALSAELGMRALNLAVGEAALVSSDDNVEGKSQPDRSSSDKGHGGILLPGGNLVVKLLESEDVKGYFSMRYRICHHFLACSNS
ncbi:OLC1v1027600C1 [Oldenlandia corymbosa var. corymbosa]|uniref:rRNA methyltransferase 2, mitochondrial n=1 Tax=Oldenlandia corymbosa var. corymbosa TaxID=529605 RepID=A0AAV1C9U8_OLDCO|nr:OLC1v1027600C1 [Oldenlandia corymbosa var. corymbosa]